MIDINLYDRRTGGAGWSTEDQSALSTKTLTKMSGARCQGVRSVVLYKYFAGGECHTVTVVVEYPGSSWLPALLSSRHSLRRLN